MRGRNILISGLACTLMLSVVGCKKETPPPPPPPPTQPTAPPPPEPIDVRNLMSQMDADARLTFPQELAPVDEDLARSVVTFAGALLNGDDEAVRSMLDLAGQATLDRLLVTGGWYDATDELEAIEVIDLTEAGAGQGGRVTYALQAPGSAYLLAWSIIPGPDGGYVFSADESDPEERPRASDFADSNFESQAESTLAAEDSELLKQQQMMESPILIYLSLETTSILMHDAMGVDMSGEQMMAQAAALDKTGDVAKAQSLFNDGKAAAQRGEQPNAAQVRALVDLLSAQLSMASSQPGSNINITKDMIISALAKAMNTDDSEVNKLYNEGG